MGSHRWNPGFPGALCVILLGVPFAAAVLSGATAEAPPDRCAAEVRLEEPSGAAPRVPLVVTATDLEGRTHAATTTPNDPVVWFPDLPCGPHRVELQLPPGSWPPDYEAPPPLRRTVVELSPEDPAEVKIPIFPIRPVAIRVSDPDGHPVGGGFVDCFGPALDPDSHLPSGALIGDDGTGRLLVSPGSYEFSYRGGGSFEFRPHRVNGRPNESEWIELGDDSLEIEFVVDPAEKGWVVTGVVLDPDGKGAPEIQVSRWIHRWGRWDSVTESGDDGRFEARFERRDRQVEIGAEDPRGRWTFEPERIFVKPGTGGPVVFRAVPVAGPRIGARVVGEGSGEPVVDAHVMADLDCLEDPLLTRLYSESTDAEGRFTLPCAPGCPGEVSIYPYWSESPAYFSESALPVPEDACDGNWEIVLERGSTLSGRVVDPYGFPVAGLPLVIGRFESELQAKEWKTDEGGAFAFRPLWPGSYAVRVDFMRAGLVNRWVYLADPGADGDAPWPVIEVGEAEDVTRELVARPGGQLCVEGVMVPDSERPLPFRGIRVSPADETSLGLTTAEVMRLFWHKTGCSTGLRPGDWRFLGGSGEWLAPKWSPAEEPGGPSAYRIRPGERTTVKPLPGERPAVVDALLPGWMPNPNDRVRLSLRIDSAADRRDLPEAEPRPWIAVPPERFMLDGFSEEEAFSVGSWLPPGSYHLRAQVESPEHGRTRTWNSPSLVILEPSDRRVIRMVLGDVFLEVGSDGLTWRGVDAETGYDVVGGVLGELPGGGAGASRTLVLLASGHEEERLDDEREPRPGEGYWYLVKQAPAGSFNTGSPAQTGDRDRWAVAESLPSP